MADLDVVMREQALAGLNTQLDAAVTNGDTEAARKVTQQIAQLAVHSAPKAPPFTPDDIRTELDKQPWFGIDPKKSAKAIELGKSMDLKKFATAAAYAEALVKAVDEEFKVTPKAGEGEDEPGEDEPGEDAAGEKKPRVTDGPKDTDTGARSARRTSGPWTKLSDATPEAQKEIKRQEAKFVSSAATKEQREKFVASALESHYNIHKNKGKK